MKTFIRIASVLIFASILGGCSAPAPKTVTINGATDNNTTVTLNKGDTLLVVLEGNPTTGYTWERAVSDDTIIAQEGSYKFEPSSSAIGAGGKLTLTFKAVNPGTQSLELVYHRSFEKDKPPMSTFVAKVVVK